MTDLERRTAPDTPHVTGFPASQSYRLRATLRRCQFGSRTVCLDLSASRYFLLEGVAATDLAAFDNGTADRNVIARLIELGWLENGTPETAPMAVSPKMSLLDHQLPRPSPWLLYRSIAEQRIARRALGRDSLGELLKPTAIASANPDHCRPVAAAFARASRYRDATDQCLVRSLAMRAMLARRGLGVDLVIGVMLPFAAHCWLQSGSVVLSDPLDHVRNFKPLLTVR